VTVCNRVLQLFDGFYFRHNSGQRLLNILRWSVNRNKVFTPSLTVRILPASFQQSVSLAVRRRFHQIGSTRFCGRRSVFVTGSASERLSLRRRQALADKPGRSRSCRTALVLRRRVRLMQPLECQGDGG
jgi:hypothetical protein